MSNKNQLMPQKPVPAVKGTGDLEVLKILKGNIAGIIALPLSDEEKRRLIIEACEGKIAVDKAERDIDAVVKLVNDAITTGEDYEINLETQTGTGNIKARFTRNNNTVIIVIAIVIGVLILAIF